MRLIDLRYFYVLLGLVLLESSLCAQSANIDPPIYSGQDRTFEFHSAAGETDTSAIIRTDARFAGWATGYEVSYGTNVDEVWRQPANALGPATGLNFDVVSLGRGGQITLTFEHSIYDGTGPDFAVFENGFDDRFLELCWVEVSSDGIHFVRFPNFSYTAFSVGGFGDVEPRFVHGFGGKYRLGYGTPFDLSELSKAYAAALAGTDVSFSAAYKADLLANYPELDLSAITHVRLIDIVGDGNARDVDGNVDSGLGAVIYDPYPTIGSAGFDLEAVGVLNQIPAEGLAQEIVFDAIENQRLDTGSLDLSATASSGLAVRFTVTEGPASVDGSVLSFTGLGTVVIQASQSGDATYAAAAPVTRRFIVADELQHIFVQPVSNQFVNATGISLNAISSSGLPVSLFVDTGPEHAVVTEQTHLFSSGPALGNVRIRASQSGGTVSDVVYAPADDVFVDFEIVAANSSLGPQGFSDWQAGYGLVGNAGADSDADGSSDFEEYVANSDPLNPSIRPVLLAESASEAEALLLEYVLNARAVYDLNIETSSDLGEVSAWQTIVPEIESIVNGLEAGEPNRTLRIRVPYDGESSRFLRLKLTGGATQ